MIDFSKYPRTKEVTYTIIPRYAAKKLNIALQLAKETNYKIRTKPSENLKKHLPKWFDPTYAVLLSNFDSQYVLNHIDDILDDTDVQNAINKKLKQDAEEHEQNHKWVETEGVQPWKNGIKQ